MMTPIALRPDYAAARRNFRWAVAAYAVGGMAPLAARRDTGAVKFISQMK
jgi:hypothetical protein